MLLRAALLELIATPSKILKVSSGKWERNWSKLTSGEESRLFSSFSFPRLTNIINAKIASLLKFSEQVGYALRIAFNSQEVTNFFRKMVSDVMNMRERTGQIRKDFMQLLTELKEKGHIAVHDAEEEKEIDGRAQRVFQKLKSNRIVW